MLSCVRHIVAVWSHDKQIAQMVACAKQKGSFFGGGGVRPADEEDLFSYFSARCYSGYADDKQVIQPTLVGVRSAHALSAALELRVWTFLRLTTSVLA